MVVLVEKDDEEEEAEVEMKNSWWGSSRRPWRSHRVSWWYKTAWTSCSILEKGERRIDK